MDARIPQSVQPTLQQFLGRINQELPGLIKVCYIEGSIALGGFNARLSDIDFLLVLDRTISMAEIETLRRIHRAIEQAYPEREFQGTYLPVAAWPLFADPNEARGQSYFDLLQPYKRFEVDSVEGWILKHKGIALIGPDPQSLPFSVDWKVLIQKMRENLNTFWASYTRNPARMAALLIDWGIQWTVLGVLRQFYSFREGSITTKTKAGEYALTCLPSKWHRLIQEAIDIRELGQVSAYRSQIMRAIEARGFVKYVIQLCNADSLG